MTYKKEFSGDDALKNTNKPGLRPHNKAILRAMEIIEMVRYKETGRCVLAGMLLMASCVTKPNIETTIRKKIEQECPSDSCTINLNQVLQFDWDKMIAFSDAAPPEVINDAIGKEYPSFVEFTRPMIFLRNKKIVRYENNALDNEGPIDGQVIFQSP
jgi:hypothetical protein